MQKRGWRNYPPPAEGNPYYREARAWNDKTQRRERTARVLLAGFVVAAIVTTLIAHPVLKIQTIELEGLPSQTAQKIEDHLNEALNGRRMGIFPRKNVLFLDRRRIRSVITAEFIPDEIRITPQWGRKLLVAVIPFPTVFYWKDHTGMYSVNQKGIITEQIPNKKPLQHTVTIGEDSARQVTLGKTILAQEEMEWTLSFMKEFQGVFNQTPSRLIFSVSHPEIVETEFMGSFITVSTREDPRLQILRLELIVKKAATVGGGNALNNRRRIDLRFGEKIYIQ